MGKYKLLYDAEVMAVGDPESLRAQVESLGIVNDLGNGMYHVYDREGGPVLIFAQIVPAGTQETEVASSDEEIEEAGYGLV